MDRFEVWKKVWAPLEITAESRELSDTYSAIRKFTVWKEIYIAMMWIVLNFEKFVSGLEIIPW